MLGSPALMVFIRPSATFSRKGRRHRAEGAVRGSPPTLASLWLAPSCATLPARGREGLVGGAACYPPFKRALMAFSPKSLHWSDLALGTARSPARAGVYGRPLH